MDPYKVLGVKTAATVSQIRKAYRKKSIKAHPDTGGSAEEFAKLKLAHDILIDPVRRERYDTTGDVSEKSADNSMSQVIGILATIMDKVIGKIEQRGGSPTEYQLLEDMKIMLGGDLDQIAVTRKAMLDAKRKTEKLLGRFGVKKGENYLEGILIGKISALDTHLRMCDEKDKQVRQALEILKNSTFKSDAEGANTGFIYGSAYNLADLMGAI